MIPEDGQTMKKRKILSITVISLTVLLVLYLAVSFLVIIGSRVARLPLTDFPSADGPVYENVSFPSRGDHVTLHGWYFPGRLETVIIMVTGGMQNRVDSRTGTLEIAIDLHSQGYSILKFDLRGRGESDGSGRLLTHDQRDIGGALDFVTAQGYAPENVCLMGFSAGAKSSLVFAHRETVGAVIADSSFISLSNDLVRKVSRETIIPEPLVRLFVPGTLLLAEIIFDYKAVNLNEIIHKIEKPKLFIYGELDDMVTMAEVRSLYARASHPLDEIYIAPGAGHSLAYHSSPPQYIDSVVAFLKSLE